MTEEQREQDAKRSLYETVANVEADWFSSAAISENVVIAAMLAFADEARLAETYTRVLPPHGGKA